MQKVTFRSCSDYSGYTKKTKQNRRLHPKASCLSEDIQMHSRSQAGIRESVRELRNKQC